MQDKYAGDVGDFGKYVLLSEVCRIDPHLRLGINWYRVVREEAGSNDGRHIQYLNDDQRFRECHPGIYAGLQKIIEGNNRSVTQIEARCILPPSTLYFSEPLPCTNQIQHRITERDKWFERSETALNNASVLFLDPDNGIQTPRVTRKQQNAVKYCFVDEMQRYIDVGKVIIVYNHRDRSPVQRYAERFIQVRQQFGSTINLRVLRFKRVSVRDYLFFSRDTEAHWIDQLFERLIQPPFDFLFDEFILPSTTRTHHERNTR